MHCSFCLIILTELWLRFGSIPNKNRFLKFYSHTGLTHRMQLAVIYSWLTVVIHLKPSLWQSITGRKLLANILVGAITKSFSNSVNTQCTASHIAGLSGPALLGTPLRCCGSTAEQHPSEQQHSNKTRRKMRRQATKRMASDFHCPPKSLQWK